MCLLFSFAGLSLSQTHKELLFPLDAGVKETLTPLYSELIETLEDWSKPGRIEIYRADTDTLADDGNLIQITALGGESIEVISKGIVVRGVSAHWYGIAADPVSGEPFRISLDLFVLIAGADGSARHIGDVPGLMVREHTPHPQFIRHSKQYLSPREQIRYVLQWNELRVCLRCARLNVTRLDELGEFVVVYEEDPGKKPRIGDL